MPEKRNEFIARNEFIKFKDEISQIIKLRKIEKLVDVIDEGNLKERIGENFEDVVEVYKTIKEKYPTQFQPNNKIYLASGTGRQRKSQLKRPLMFSFTRQGLQEFKRSLL